MCFYIRNTKKEATLYEALEDITCYKLLSETLVSPYQGCRYKLGVLKTSRLEKPKTIINGVYQFKLYEHLSYFEMNILHSIDIGLHSYQNKQKARDKNNSFLFKEKIFKCIIPKGSLFYRNDFNKEYVSNKLIVIKQVK